MLVLWGVWGCAGDPAASPTDTEQAADTGAPSVGGVETGRGQHDTAPIQTHTGGLTAVSGGALVTDGGTLALGGVPVGVGVLDVEITLTNTTDQDLALSAALDGAAFAWTAEAPAVLAAGDSAQLGLQFSPSEAGAVLGQLVVTPDSGAPLSVWLEAEGLAPPTVVWVGSSGRLIRSTDLGVSWVDDQQVSAMGSNQFRGVAWGAGRFVAVGGWSGADYYYSDDGQSWTQGTESSRNGIGDVAYGNGRFVSVGTFGNLAWSEDGALWFEENNDYSTHLDAVAFGDGAFVAVGRTRRAATSDGVSWSSDAEFSGTYLSDVAFGDGVFVAVGTSGLIATSSDGGQSWTDQTVGSAGRDSVVYAEGRFLTGSWPDGVLASEDGLTWTTLSETTWLSPSCAVGGLLFATSGQGQMFRSADGVTYEQTRENDADTSSPGFSRCAVAGW